MGQIFRRFSKIFRAVAFLSLGITGNNVSFQIKSMQQQSGTTTQTHTHLSLLCFLPLFFRFPRRVGDELPTLHITLEPTENRGMRHKDTLSLVTCTFGGTSARSLTLTAMLLIGNIQFPLVLSQIHVQLLLSCLLILLKKKIIHRTLTGL